MGQGRHTLRSISDPISKRFRDKRLIKKRYINLSVYFPFTLCFIKRFIRPCTVYVCE